MRRVVPALVILFALSLVTFLSAQRPSPAPPARGIDEAAMDKAVDPCIDFYQYACGGWIQSHPVPPDRASFGRFVELRERNEIVLRDILEKAAADQPARTPLEKKIGDYYASCMDEARINHDGIAPLNNWLARLDAMKSKDELPERVAELYHHGVRPFFGLRITQDAREATQMIVTVGAGGMGLPDRDYYLKEDPKTAEIRARYLEHVQKMLRLAGAGETQAAADARAILAIETELARSALDRVARREPSNVYHKMTRQEFAALSPAFSWDRFLGGVQAPPIASLNVAEPAFVKGVQAVIEQNPLPALQAYLRWHILNSLAAFLSSDFVNEDFDFNERVLRGVKEMEPRWRRCVRATDRQLGELLGQPYVERNFGPDAKARTLQMVREIEAVMQQDIDSLPWMTPETRKQALLKLHAVANKIGYPEKWRDYSSLTITRGDLVGNVVRADTFEFRRNLAKLGKPVDKLEWGMTPPTVNAYYSPTQNNINFPAGILQPPFYAREREEAVNYGGIGGVVGHELTHGFDDQGRKFDPNGNLRDWWTARDGEEFVKRAGCIDEQYSAFEPLQGVHVNGKLTLGENTADNGGLRLAYLAMKKALAGKEQKNPQGFTPEQLLFLGWAQVWCENQRPEQLRLMVATNPHSPGRFRVIGPLQNMPEFQQAFGCKAGQPMVRANACRVW